jgi:chromosome segregation ATPase
LDEQAKSLETGIRDADRRIKEFFEQTKIIDQANELKVDMEHRLEDLRGDIDRLDQRQMEASQMESEFVKIRRLGDEVNAKMARMVSEKYRIDKMETDFNRLLQTSRVVEEKLTQVKSSDDVLQETLVQIRRFEEALTGAEEKFQRLEKKDQVLEITTEGVDKNFRELQKLEKGIKRIGEDLAYIASEEASLKETVSVLAEQNVKARETSERIESLDDALSEIAEKTRAMQTAREWIARAESRLEELNKQTQTQFKVMDAVMNGKKDSFTPAIGDGAPSIQKKETVLQLARQGWTKEAIAKTMKLSLGEVELILETFFKI